MKMKEVCARTGLSERAVRFYCEQDLLTPQRTEVRGRIYLEFDENDIDVLQQIATLRSAGLSLEEIRTVQNEPHLIGRILCTLRTRLAREREVQDAISERLSRLEAGSAPADMAALAAALRPVELVRPYENSAVFRHDELSFPAFCAQRAYGDSGDEESSLDRNVYRGRIVMLCYNVFYWCIAAAAVLVALPAKEGLFFSLLVAAIFVLLFIFLRRDAGWARALLCVAHFFGALVSCALFLDNLPFKQPNGTVPEPVPEAIIGLLILVLINIASVYFLGFNKWVADYLYDCATRE